MCVPGSIFIALFSIQFFMLKLHFSLSKKKTTKWNNDILKLQEFMFKLSIFCRSIERKKCNLAKLFTGTGGASWYEGFSDNFSSGIIDLTSSWCHEFASHFTRYIFSRKTGLTFLLLLLCSFMYAMPIANTEYKADNYERLLCSLNFNKFLQRKYL